MVRTNTRFKIYISQFLLSCYEANIFKFLKLLLKAKKKKSIKIHDLTEDRHKSVVEWNLLMRSVVSWLHSHQLARYKKIYRDLISHIKTTYNHRNKCGLVINIALFIQIYLKSNNLLKWLLKLIWNGGNIRKLRYNALLSHVI